LVETVAFEGRINFKYKKLALIEISEGKVALNPKNVCGIAVDVVEATA